MPSRSPSCFKETAPDNSGAVQSQIAVCYELGDGAGSFVFLSGLRLLPYSEEAVPSAKHQLAAACA